MGSFAPYGASWVRRKSAKGMQRAWHGLLASRIVRAVVGVTVTYLIWGVSGIVIVVGLYYLFTLFEEEEA